jgi:hypothetical protein
MNESKQTWSEVADRLEALGLKLKLHGEQTGGTELPDALNRLGHSLQETFEAAGNAFKDEAVREDVREIGRLVAGAVTTTVDKMGEDMRQAARKR